MTRATKRVKLQPAGRLPDGFNVVAFPSRRAQTELTRNQRVRAALVALNRSYNNCLDALQFLDRKDYDLGTAVNAIDDNIEKTWVALDRLGIVVDD
jgi:hypothetical protein